MIIYSKWVSDLAPSLEAYEQMNFSYEIIQRHQPRDLEFELSLNCDSLIVISSDGAEDLCNEMVLHWLRPQNLMWIYFHRLQEATREVKLVLAFLDNNTVLPGGNCYFCGERRVHRPDCQYLQYIFVNKVLGRME